MNRRVLVTGSTSGIGWGIARKFAEQKDHVILNGLDPEGASLAQELEREFGIKSGFSSADLSTSQGVESLIEYTRERLGGIDVLVNNAGIQHVSKIEDFPNEKYEKIIALNLNSVFYASKAVFKEMKDQNFGRIINISSVHGIRASEYKSAYVAAKHGVIGLTKVLALEGATFGVTSNAICPGYVLTPLVEAQIKDQAREHGLSEKEVVEKVLLKKQAVKSFVSLEKIAELCVFLADNNAQSISGSVFTLDGGWSAQ